MGKRTQRMSFKDAMDIAESMDLPDGALFRGGWNDTSGKSVGMYLGLEMEDHAWEKRVSEALRAADAARAVSDEEVRGALWDGWTDIQRYRIVADLHAAGLKVVRR